MRTRSGYDVKVEVTGTEGSVATEANPTSFPLLRKDGHVGVGIATIEGWLDRFEETCEPRSDSDPIGTMRSLLLRPARALTPLVLRLRDGLRLNDVGNRVS